MGPIRLVLRLVGLAVVTTPIFLILVAGRLLGLVVPGVSFAAEDFCTTTWARASLLILGVDIQVRGRAPRAPYFLVANHLSYLDILVFFVCLRGGRFLAKAEVSRWPILGLLSRTAGTLFIDRTRARDLSRVLPEVRSALDSGRGVVVFPEGTSTRGAEVGHFKPSIFQVPILTGVPVSYAAIGYRTPEGAPPADLSVCWWGDAEFLPHFFSLLMLPRIHATVAFGDQSLTAEDRKDLASRARSAVESQFTPVVG
jgi:1-acyl-sn-glycerol-3-phosphate acyltransferase